MVKHNQHKICYKFMWKKAVQCICSWQHDINMQRAILRGMDKYSTAIDMCLFFMTTVKMICRWILGMISSSYSILALIHQCYILSFTEILYSVDCSFLFSELPAHTTENGFWSIFQEISAIQYASYYNWWWVAYLNLNFTLLVAMLHTWYNFYLLTGSYGAIPRDDVSIYSSPSCNFSCCNVHSWLGTTLFSSVANSN